MNQAKQLLGALNLPVGDCYDLPTSTLRFADGAHYRIEIPSVEGPAAMAAVLEAAAGRGRFLEHGVAAGGARVSLDQLHQAKLAGQYYRQALAAAEGRPAAFDREQAASRLRELQP